MLCKCFCKISINVPGDTSCCQMRMSLTSAKHQLDDKRARTTDACCVTLRLSAQCCIASHWRSSPGLCAQCSLCSASVVYIRGAQSHMAGMSDLCQMSVRVAFYLEADASSKCFGTMQAVMQNEFQLFLQGSAEDLTIAEHTVVPCCQWCFANASKDSTCI